MDSARNTMRTLNGLRSIVKLNWTKLSQKELIALLFNSASFAPLVVVVLSSLRPKSLERLGKPMRILVNLQQICQGNRTVDSLTLVMATTTTIINPLSARINFLKSDTCCWRQVELMSCERDVEEEQLNFSWSQTTFASKICIQFARC